MANRTSILNSKTLPQWLCLPVYIENTTHDVHCKAPGANGTCDTDSAPRRTRERRHSTASARSDAVAGAGALGRECPPSVQQAGTVAAGQQARGRECTLAAHSSARPFPRAGTSSYRAGENRASGLRRVGEGLGQGMEVEGSGTALPQTHFRYEQRARAGRSLKSCRRRRSSPDHVFAETLAAPQADC
jgi:hypothetical protein